MPGEVLKSVGFHPVIEQWFKRRFKTPSRPQKDGWPSIAAGNHTLILAPTGSGKTLTAFLWSIDQLFLKSLETDNREFDQNAFGVHTLYISPLKALNNDIHHNLKEPLKEIQQQAVNRGLASPPIRVAVRTGDTPSHVRQSMLRKPPHILITTPESFYLLLTSARGRELFRKLQYVIVDEIHAVCNNKRGVHLSLSMERMAALCQNEPVRIGLSATQKPLDRIAAYLGGRTYPSARKTNSIARPVKIIDCGQRKQMDLKVITPVTSFRELPESSVWQPVYHKLYELIQAHSTTLIFAGMRAQTEKIARELNRLHQQLIGDPQAELALAHHGSISRQARQTIEARLKIGDIPAVIATASLELGIDIGSIDLVVHLEAPRSVTGGLQRIGRSGHLLSATSKGRIMVLYPSDLDDAASIARCMHRADIEKTRIPENALDVLAQHIVAEVAIKNWEYEDLYHLVCQSYCYRNLSRMLFRSVVEMLSGRFADIPQQAFQPRLNWDRVNNCLIARRGSRMLAVMNGGTIPDRGYYGVYLENSNVKLGEVEEEFVFESRVGEVFFLGNSEWLIKQITTDRVIASPVAAINPRAPFWKGDILHRDYSTSKKIGSFRRQLVAKIQNGKANKWLMEKCFVDKNTAANLVSYFDRQKKIGNLIATDKQVVAEWTIDSGGQSILLIHAVFGARVNGAWAIALSAALDQHYQIQIQYSFDDDGILFRLPDAIEPPPFDWLFKLTAQKIEQFLMAALPQTTVFQVHFRYNTARALMLPRSHPGKRIPLWLQRLRASDLLQAVGERAEFPIIIETFRECLNDVLDLAALKTIIEDLNNNRIRIDLIDTPLPSPMAAGILFKFVSVHLYETEQIRKKASGSALSSDLLHEILDQPKIPAIVTYEMISQAERRWQHLDLHFQAASREDVFSIIEKLGPIDDENLKRRCKHDPTRWLSELKNADRISSSNVRSGEKFLRSWRIREVHTATPDKNDRESIGGRIRKFMRVRGPVSTTAIADHLNLPSHLLRRALEDMRRQKELVYGQLIADGREKQWCDRHNFTQLYRMAIARRRTVQAPATGLMFTSFLLEWHRISKFEKSLKELILRYRGIRFPLNFFESEILRSRYHNTDVAKFNAKLAQFEALIASGEVIVHSGRSNDTGNRYVEFGIRGEGNLLTEEQNLLTAAENLSKPAKTIYFFLKEHGASYARDIQWATDLSNLALNRGLQELADKSLIGCEAYQTFMLIYQSQANAEDSTSENYLLTKGKQHLKMQYRRHRTKKSNLRKSIRDTSKIKDARWFLTNSLVIMGRPMDIHERAQNQARLLLQRYGILVKEWYRREHGLLPWYQIFQVLKRLEWQGEIRRGYFVSGLSGVQFALPEALELLQSKIRPTASPQSDPILLNTKDPALPYGGGIDWGLTDTNGYPLKVKRSASNHLIFMDGIAIIYCERYFQHLTILQSFPQNTWESLSRIFKNYLKLTRPLKRVNRIDIHVINGHPAATGSFSDQLVKSGFEKDAGHLILWPSAV